MHLVSDYIHPTPRGGRCRVRIYPPKEEPDSPVVICSELPSNEGSSVTNSAHKISAEVIRYHKLSAPVWIEHYPKEATDGTSETFELVGFSSYQIRERAPYLEEMRPTIGEPTWKTLDRETVNHDRGNRRGAACLRSDDRLPNELGSIVVLRPAPPRGGGLLDGRA
jgi:hypothetical protein